MLTFILAGAGVVLGAAGLLLGALAFLRSRAVVADSHALVGRLLQDSSGVDGRAIRDIGVVRYDALEQMSGARSFSLALLNTVGDGIVLTSINGRSETRTYAKAVQQGQATEALSPEEYRAVRAARLGTGPGSPPAQGREAEVSPTVSPTGADEV